LRDRPVVQVWYMPLDDLYRKRFESVVIYPDDLQRKFAGELQFWFPSFFL